MPKAKQVTGLRIPVPSDANAIEVILLTAGAAEHTFLFDPRTAKMLRDAVDNAEMIATRRPDGVFRQVVHHDKIEIVLDKTLGQYVMVITDARREIVVPISLSDAEVLNETSKKMLAAGEPPKPLAN